MKINIQIKGDKDTIEILKFLETEIKNPVEPLKSSSKLYLKEISTNFENLGSTFGEKWKPLEKSTIRIKRALYAKGEAIAIETPLVRTGAMREGFNYNMPNKKTSDIYNTQEYAKAHQEGAGVPKRVLAEVDTTRVEMVGNVFRDWINRLIKSKNAGK